ncbi:MAG: FliH/SctL family protein [Vampirovibrionales bacterium]|nr:FliH/SctL family protein [Vampirovibrionales bacterium]
MAIIKRQDLHYQQASHSIEKPPSLVIDYSEQSVLDGILPDRRKSQDRREKSGKTGYRRLEDRLMISTAEQEAIEIKKNAYQDGYQAGLDSAQETVFALQEAIVRYQNARQEALLNASEELASMALAIAEKLMKTEAKCDPDLVVAIARDAIQALSGEAKRIRIRVHPDDLPRLHAVIQQNPHTLHLDAELVAFADPAVDLGSCMVETPSGTIDARFSTQLNALGRLLGLHPC